MELKLTPVDQDQATKIANIQRLRFAEAEYPLRHDWLEGRIEELMRIGASDGELQLLQDAYSR